MNTARHACDALRYVSMVEKDLYGAHQHMDLEEWRRMKKQNQFGSQKGQGIEDFMKPGW